MSTFVVDKIASVNKNAYLGSQIEVTSSILSEEGSIIVVEVLEDKKIYNQLELVSGELVVLKKGDIVVVALGNRKALKGFVGEVPKKLEVNDVINILNIGGVAGICTSENLHEVGHALKVKVLGSTGKNIKDFRLFAPKDSIESSTPIIMVSGTCMNVGKTSVVCEIIKHASQQKFKIAAAKLAGIAALKDMERMKDYGATQVTSFIDAGYTSTVNNGNLSVAVTKGAIDYLAQSSPDYIIIELGDGLFGEYGVIDILSNSEIQKKIRAHVGCAHDLMGAAKLQEECEKIGAPLHLVSGPVSDNSVGIEFIKKNLHLPSINALYNGKALFEYVKQLHQRK